MGALVHVAVALAMASVGGLIGGSWLQAGLAEADEGWAMQGAVIVSFSVLFSALMLLPNLWLAVRPGRSREKEQAPVPDGLPLGEGSRPDAE